MTRFRVETIRSLAVLILLGLMTGCVTTSDSPFQREADRDEAVQKYVKLAMAYIGQGNMERARGHLDRALELDPDNAGGQAAMGLVYQSELEPELAEKAYQNALSSDPGYTRGRVFYGAFLFGQNRFADAREQFQRASEDTEFGERASVFFNLGITEERLDNLQAAARAYRRSVELSRGDAQSLLALSRVLFELDDFQGAERYYNRLTVTMQRNPNMRHSPQSLLTGIRIARHFSDHDRESSLALLLRNKFPDSEEYQQYKVLNSDVE